MKKQTPDRRKLLKSIAVGSAAVAAGASLPEAWTKPVISSIVLPAHAQTTTDEGEGLPGTPDCCLTAQTYCATIEGSYFDIAVDVDGNVEIQFVDGEIIAVLNASTSCTGGSFDVTSLQGNHTFTGTIICGQDIEGTVSIYGQEPPLPYTASPNNCDKIVL